MPRYTQEKKDYALSLMSPPKNFSVAEVAGQTGISAPTLYGWRNQARAQGRAVPGDGNNAEDWKAEDKFAVVVETMGLAVYLSGSRPLEAGEPERAAGAVVRQH